MSDDAKKAIRLARARVERRRDDVVEAAEDYVDAPEGEGRRKLAALRDAVDDLRATRREWNRLRLAQALNPQAGDMERASDRDATHDAEACVAHLDEALDDAEEAVSALPDRAEES